MGATGLLATSFGAQAVTSAFSGYNQSQDALAKAAYKKQVYDTNARIAKIQGDDAIRRGEQSAENVGRQVRAAIGSQRADLAAQGVDVNSGSAADVQASTAGLGALDELNIRNNAWRESWGYKMQASEDSMQGKLAEIAGENESTDTLLTGGLNALTYGLKGAAAAYAGGGRGGGGLRGGYVGPDSFGNTYT